MDNQKNLTNKDLVAAHTKGICAHQRLFTTYFTALLLMMLTTLTARADALTGFLSCSSGSATGYFTYSDHFYKVEWTGINTSETTSVQLIEENGCLMVRRNSNSGSTSALYANATEWQVSSITSLTEGESSSGETNGAGTGSSSTITCTITCTPADEPTWNWSTDRSSCTATFICTESPGLIRTISANVTSINNVMIEYKASVTFNGLDKNSSILSKPSPIVPPALAFNTLTYNANGHGTAPSPEFFATGTSTIVTEPAAPTAAGYVFGGWNRDKECTKPFDFNTFVLKDLTLYAKWTPLATMNIAANQASLNGVTKYWTTFYHPTDSYLLPEGASAFTLNGNKELYRVGDGNITPAGVAVIIMADAQALDANGDIVLTLTDHTPMPSGDYIMRGTEEATSASAVAYGKQVYVLSKVGESFGTFQFMGEIPALKAFYIE